TSAVGVSTPSRSNNTASQFVQSTHPTLVDGSAGCGKLRLTAQLGDPAATAGAEFASDIGQVQPGSVEALTAAQRASAGPSGVRTEEGQADLVGVGMDHSDPVATRQARHARVPQPVGVAAAGRH